MSEETLPDEINNILNSHNLPPKEKEQIVQAIIARIQTTVTNTSFVGPMPPPEVLQGYENVLKGSAERILAMAERQSSHRQRLERKVVNQSNLGQVFGFIIGLICLSMGCWLAYLDKDGLAGVLFTTTIIGLVSVFVTGKTKRSKDTSDK